MLRIHTLLIIIALISISCNNSSTETAINNNKSVKEPILNINEAHRLAQLPIACVGKEYPNKLNQTIAGNEDLRSPSDLHPAFFGCFDWHSSVHGHWSLVKLIKIFPDLEDKDLIISTLSERITDESINKEIEYFMQEHNRNFERTYGWAWLLKLAEELHTWDDPVARKLETSLSPLAELIALKYIEFLPKLNYPIRVGTHTNTAFGLTFAYDYGLSLGNDALLAVIKERARDFYFYDTDCPLSWEPGGEDFLSPCLEEVNIMMRVLDREEFIPWLAGFMPQLSNPAYSLEPGIVSDRSDGKLAHLDGLNFSRAWCFYDLANYLDQYKHLKTLGDIHINHSLPDITSDHYEGSHWLGSFALLALDSRDK